MESELNNSKNLLANPAFQSIKDSSAFEISTKQARKDIGRTYNAQNVTKAWLKMADMLLHIRFVDIVKGTKVKAFFNAELPGGFVFATNHILRTNNIPFDWVVSSLYPIDQKTGLTDMYGLIGGNPDKSLVGEFNSNKGRIWCDGDLTKPKVCDFLVQRCLAKIGKVNLYTSDGGFDVEGQENAQETLSIPLIMGEISVGIRVLDIGGTLILKMFTFFTPKMQGMVCWLARHFEKFVLYKPSASSNLNSEVYFIGLNFKGYTGEVVMTPEEQNLIDRYQQFFAAQQIQTINNLINNRTSVPINIQSFNGLIPIDKSQWIKTKTE